jgi:hypothetical protein
MKTVLLEMIERWVSQNMLRRDWFPRVLHEFDRARPNHGTEGKIVGSVEPLTVSTGQIVIDPFSGG